MLAGCSTGANHDLQAVHQGTPSCLEAACHPAFEVGGSVFTGLDAETHAYGVELHLIDAGGGERLVAASDERGLLWSDDELPGGTVTFRLGDVTSLDHRLPGDADCHTCHTAEGAGGAPGALVGNDVFAPQLLEASPIDGDDDVDPGASLVLRFDEALDPATVTAATVRLVGPDGQVQLELSASADSPLIVATGELDAAAEHSLFLERGLTDASGNGLEEQLRLDFRTAGTFGPQVVASWPASGATDVDPATTMQLQVEPAPDPDHLDGISLDSRCDLAGFELDVDDELISLRPLLPLPEGSTCTLTVADLQADELVQDGAWVLGFSTWDDTTPPTPVARVPSPGRNRVPTESVVQVAWSEELATGGSLLVEADGVAIDGTVERQGAVATWTGTLPEHATVLVSQDVPVTDTAGHQGTAPRTWSFETGTVPDERPLSLVGANPADGSVDVDVSVQPRLVLDGDPDLRTLDVVQLWTGADQLPVTAAWDDAEREVIVTPLVELDPDTTYTLRVYPGLAELSGLQTDELQESRFTTAADATAGSPTFDGLVSATATGTDSVLLTWDPGNDDTTPTDQLVYDAYVAETSGEQDLAVATAASDPGATELELEGLDAGSTIFVLVRARDADGLRDDNRVEHEVTTDVSWSSQISPLLDDACLSCHGGSQIYGDLDVSTWDDLMDSGTVIPYDGANSPFVTKGSHHGSGWFTDAEETTLIAWIDQGALEN